MTKKISLVIISFLLGLVAFADGGSLSQVTAVKTTVQDMVAGIIPVSRYNSKAVSILLESSRLNLCTEVESLLELGIDPNCDGTDSLTPLHYACINGNPEMAKLLIKHGAFATKVDDEGWTPLDYARVNCLKL